MSNQFDQSKYYQEALRSYAADLEMQIGRAEAQKVLRRVIRDYGWWEEHVSSSKGEDLEKETWSDLKKLRIFWDAYVAYPEMSVSYIYDNPEKGSKMLDYTEKEASFPSLAEKMKKYKVCLDWAGRDPIPYQNMDEFLTSYNATAMHYLSKDQFKKLNRQAGNLGLLKKGPNGRWTPA